MFLGVLFIGIAIGLFAYNQHEAVLAERSSEMLLNELHSKMEETRSKQEKLSPEEDLPMDLLKMEMETVDIDGRSYVGEIQIPDLELSLPVLSQWSYDNLKLAPCRSSGNLKSNDLVILAHSYRRHFGRIASLAQGAELYFKDVNENITKYQVSSIEILQPDQVDEMTAGEFPLTLFTCTYDSKSRIAIRCELKNN